MKKIVSIISIVILILICININSSKAEDFKLDYTETTETFNNPERGFYTPVYIKYTENNNKVIGENEAKKNLIHLRLDIGQFSKAINGKKDIELTQDMLNSFNQTLKKIKENGGTTIVRFAYTYEGDKNKEPSIDMILTHIKQLCPIFTENQDVISYIELGFFGPWGEMHTSDVCTQENVAKALDVMLNNTPEKIKIGVRQPKYYTYWAGIERDKLSENVTTLGTKEYRVGLYNDGYLGSESDLGTFNNRNLEIKWLEKQANHTLYGGEVVANYASGTPLNTVKYMSEEAFKTHTTYLNGIYNDKVLEAWKNEKYEGEDQLYKGENGYTYIANHLGYRFVIRKANIQNKVEQGKKINVELNIENVGFANLINSKIVTIVFSKNDKIYEVKTKIDPTKWESKQTTKLQFEVDVPEKLVDGNWNIYLRISQYGNLKIDNNYQCIRFANEGQMWNQDIGANYIGNTTVIKKAEENENKVENNIITNIVNDVTDNTEKNITNDNNNIVEDTTISNIKKDNNEPNNVVKKDNLENSTTDTVINNSSASINNVVENTNIKMADNTTSKVIYPHTGNDAFTIIKVLIAIFILISIYIYINSFI